jgi:hypothetical protein
MFEFFKTLSVIQTRVICILVLLIVHSHMMFKSLLNEILGGILGGTNC